MECKCRGHSQNDQSSIALEYYGNKISRKDYWKYISKYRKFFNSLGLNDGESVAICMLNSPEYEFIFAALLENGAIASTVSKSFLNADIKRQTIERNITVTAEDGTQKIYKLFITNTTPKEVIEDILKAKGIDGYHELYLSSNIGKQKLKTLFQFILEKENIKPQELLHIGDNENADYLKPLSLDCNSVLYSPVFKRFIKTNTNNE